jgi:TraG P-loop domain
MSEQSIQLPDGYLYDRFEVWGDPGLGSIVSRGCSIEFPDLSASDPQAYLDLQTDLRMILARVGADERIQLTFFTNAEFGADLDRYDAQTETAQCPQVTRRVRRDLVRRFRKRMESETLIRSNCRIYFSAKLQPLKNESGKRIRGFRQVFEVVKRSFESREAYIAMLLRRYGGTIQPLDMMGHYRDLVGFWSPSVSPLLDEREPDWHRTIQDIAQFSEVCHRQAPDHGLCVDGYYYGVMVFKTTPRRTRQSTMDPFLNLAIPGLRVVVNAEPLSIETEMQYEESRFSKLMSNIDVENPSLESEIGLQKHRDRMARLMSNQTIPFKAQVLVLACDRTTEGLDRKMEAVRAAIAKTGAEWHRPMVPTSVLAFYNCATPGIGPWVRYKDFRHKLDDINLANLLPAGSTPRAELEKADWIFDNDVNGLLGGRFFGGAEPLHAFVAGTTGAGKSALMQALLLQALPFRYVVVIDNGGSYELTCRSLDPQSRSLTISSKGDQCFNILDTGGQPLSPQHLSAATALCHLLVGRSKDEDNDRLRHALLAETINELYLSAYRRWRNDNPEAHFDVCCEALRAEGLGFDADAALALDADPDTEHLPRNLAVSKWAPSQFPTLSTLQDALNAQANQRGKHQDIYASLATLLRPWLRDGHYGGLLDGVSDVNLGSTEISLKTPMRVIHIELGEIAESEPELLAVAGFVVLNQIRNVVMGMRRDVPKQVIFEELSSFLQIPDGGKVVTAFYQTMRKYSCQVISVAQQYGGIVSADPAVARALIGNASQLFLLRNQNRDELNAFSAFIKLPEPVKDRLQRFPKPEDMRGMPGAHSGFVYVSLTGPEPKFTIGKSVLSDEVERLTASGGADFERRGERNAKMDVAA